MDGFVPWPPELAQQYRQRGMWRGVALGEALEEAALANADRVAVVEADRRVQLGAERRITFGELRLRARRLASSFVARGICDGERIVFQLPNVIEFVVAYFAALKVGAIPIMCLPHHREGEIRAIASLGGACAWIFAARSRSFDYLEMATQLKPEIPSLRELIVVGGGDGQRATDFDALMASGREDDPELERHIPDAASPAVLQLSGGTTGIPKLIPRTHDDYLYNALAFAEASDFTRDDVLIVPLPAGHNFALACPGIQGALLLGARTVLAPSPAPDVVLPLIARERVTWVPAVPATVIQWTQWSDRALHDTELDPGDLRRRPEAQSRACARGRRGVRSGHPAGVRNGRRATLLHARRRPARGAPRHAGPADERGSTSSVSSTTTATRSRSGRSASSPAVGRTRSVATIARRSTTRRPSRATASIAAATWFEGSPPATSWSRAARRTSSIAEVRRSAPRRSRT